MARRLRHVELGFIDTAPVRLVHSAGLSAAPAVVYRALAEDVPGWTEWFDAVSTAVPTRGGAGRDIRLRIGAFFSETILATDPGERYAYRVDTTNVPGLRALLEDWRITPAPDGGSRVRWTFAADGSPVTRAVVRFAGPGLGVSFRGAMRELDRRIGDSAAR
ncbi:SRPBCC family protein [Streptomyces sp. NPDC004609]|uniref:SRPBCC family protein n=1 Tax=Streptomyces sp. NPDC004609 TaxID=3364704 RepID=UPI0036893192